MFFKPLFWCVLLAVFMPLTAQGKSTTIKEFWVTPKLCVVEKSTNCKRYFVFSWMLSHQAEACLYRAAKRTPLRCIKGQSQSQLELPLSISESESFTLKVDGGSLVRKIEVRELGVDVRQGTRHLWSVF